MIVRWVSVRFVGLRVLRGFGFRIAGIRGSSYATEGDGSLKPIELEPRSIHIQADRRLVYQVLTAFDTADRGSRG